MVLQHDEPAMITRAVNAYERRELCNEFVPVPADLSNIIAGSYGDANEQKALEAKQASNLKKYGYKDWYDFCVNKWGTKWDIGDNGSVVQTNESIVTFSFESAWSPPIGLYEKLQELGFEVTAMYYEPGVGFAGVFDECGDDCYDISNMSSTDVRDTIPTGLDAEFGISDTIEEFEEPEPLTKWYTKGVEDKGLAHE